jgi:hypothetical protein
MSLPDHLGLHATLNCRRLLGVCALIPPVSRWQSSLLFLSPSVFFFFLKKKLFFFELFFIFEILHFEVVIISYTRAQPHPGADSSPTSCLVWSGLVHYTPQSHTQATRTRAFTWFPGIHLFTATV